ALGWVGEGGVPPAGAAASACGAPAGPGGGPRRGARADSGEVASWRPSRRGDEPGRRSGEVRRPPAPGLLDGLAPVCSPSGPLASHSSKKTAPVTAAPMTRWIRYSGTRSQVMEKAATTPRPTQTTSGYLLFR